MTQQKTGHRQEGAAPDGEGLPLPSYQEWCKSLRRKAMDLLARREHTVAELHRKLQAFAEKRDHEVDAEAAHVVVNALQVEGLVSDERFAEAFVRYRMNLGFGPRRIQTELRERGVNEKIQGACLDFGSSQWLVKVMQVRCKRFGDGLPEDYKERARQVRFLQYRGFTTDQINKALGGDDD